MKLKGFASPTLPNARAIKLWMCLLRINNGFAGSNLFYHKTR